MQTLCRVQFGSHLYGTATPASDTDFKSVYIPSANEILMQRAVGTLQRNTKKNQNEKNSADDVDDEYISILKFTQMLKVGDMIASELLFVPEDQLIICHPFWKEIISNRHRLVSRDASGFVGYCRKQANKYGIKGSRVAAVRKIYDLLITLDPKAKMGVYGQTFDAFVENDEFINIIPIEQPSGLNLHHLEVCNRKIPYTVPVGEGFKIIEKLMNEYGSRALAAEKNEGVDWKSLGHAIRVSRQTIELLLTGGIKFPRADAENLKAIRRAEFTYNEVAGELDDNLLLIEKLQETSPLPESVDEDLLRQIVMDAHLNEIREWYK